MLKFFAKILCFLGMHEFEAHDFMTHQGLKDDFDAELRKVPYFECKHCGFKYL